jgi:hypothetical protein
MVLAARRFEMLATAGDPNRSAVSAGIIRAAADRGRRRCATEPGLPARTDRAGGNVGAPQCRAPLQIVPKACQTRRRAAG